MLNDITKGNLIAFEGIDGSGKTTQIKILSERLMKLGIHYYTTMEPTDGPIGTLIHQMLIGRINMDKRIVGPLIVADRFDHLLNDTNGILNKINNGTHVITDRYYFSTYAYNSIDMSLDWVIDMNKEVKKILSPTITIFIDIPPNVAMERIHKNRYTSELFEKESYLKKVREKYLESFEILKTTENVLIVDGTKDQNTISTKIWDEVCKYLL